MAPIDANANANGGSDTKVLPRGTVLIAGAGPVGLILTRVLSHFGVRSAVFERNKSTTKWPKMDLTNARSMEIFRRLGLADALREQGVPPHLDQNVLISLGLSTDKALTRWDMPGVDGSRKIIQELNDGSQPLEPWQRLSQEIFERWLKQICVDDPLVDVNCGFKLCSVREAEDGAHATAEIQNLDTGLTTSYTADYIVGCDGGSSAARTSLGIPLDGEPLPVAVLLVHFKSRDVARLHKQGRFWHIFFLEPQQGSLGGAIIAQDEVDTWTTHLFLPADADTDSIVSHEAVYRVLGGVHGPFKIDIDEILVRSVWRPTIAVSRNWASPGHRIFLAGDAAHQNIPTGGYGMNTGVGDAWDLGWKLASIINGSGGANLLESYEIERKPVATRAVQRSGDHFQVHQDLPSLLQGTDPRRLGAADDEHAAALRRKIHDHYQRHDGENKDLGIEMGFRYTSVNVIPDHDSSAAEPEWTPSRYTPTTWPGGRAPHVFLSDGTPIFDRFGKHWTLVDFASSDTESDTTNTNNNNNKHPSSSSHLLNAAQRLSIPLTHLPLPTSSEPLAARLYERPLVLVRPDQHVAWRGERVDGAADAERILRVVTGRM